MTVEEHALRFDCEGADLVGILHLPAQPRRVGLVTVAAGGIQYRAGCGRQLVTLARALAGLGIPVLRFDHRGHGDSGGELLGFRHMGTDIERAVAQLHEQVPGLEHVVLFGGCEAASALMMDAWQLPGEISLVVANPWVELAELKNSATRRHYRRRLLEAGFWKKLFSGQYDLGGYLKALLGHLARGSGNTAADAVTAPTAPFEERMLEGMQRLKGHALVLKSGQTALGGEFDELVRSSKAWQSVCGEARVRRLDLPAADQTFSTAVSRALLCDTVADWVAQREGHGP